MENMLGLRVMSMCIIKDTTMFLGAVQYLPDGLAGAFLILFHEKCWCPSFESLQKMSLPNYLQKSTCPSKNIYKKVLAPLKLKDDKSD